MFIKCVNMLKNHNDLEGYGCTQLIIRNKTHIVRTKEDY
jgi:hypothetical protein